MPRTCRVNFEDPSILHHFSLTITPDEGLWQGGRFKFQIDIPEEYNILVSLKIKTCFRTMTVFIRKKVDAY